MNIFKAYKRTKVFLFVNITGLAIGLAASIMMVLFIVYERSYDKHFKNHERIVSLNTVAEGKSNFPKNLRKAYTDLPQKVPGIEAAVQIYEGGRIDVNFETERFHNFRLLFADQEFFKVFQTKFVAGSPENPFPGPTSVVITRPKAEAIFGNAENAIGKRLVVYGQEATVSTVVEPMPRNTSFNFDILVRNNFDFSGLEFFTYYLIEEGVSVSEVRKAIEKEYTGILAPFREYFGGNIYGQTEKFTDIYLNGKADFSLGKRNSMTFIWTLSLLAIFILVFAITNFINLFTAQGETRLGEIGLRKTHGASHWDIIRQFFSEVGSVVAVAFGLGLGMAVLLIPHFSKLIQKDIDTQQFFNPVFILCLIGIFIVTIVLSASYTSFYVSRLNPLDILGKRLKFSKNRLTVAVVIFQSLITIVLMSLIMVLNRQVAYLKSLPIGYNPDNVMTIRTNPVVNIRFEAVKQELLSLPEVVEAAGADHYIGGGWSGQAIKRLNSTENSMSVAEYRVLPGLGELMRFELVEGEFFKEYSAESAKQILLNEAAVKQLGLEYPVVGQEVEYKPTATIIGVVKDFIYGQPGNIVQPLVFSLNWTESPGYIYLRFMDGIDRRHAHDIVENVLKKFDPDFILAPMWSRDTYDSKFDGMSNQTRIISTASVLSLFLGMLGLLAIHIYSAIRRTKEIGIRRVNGAKRSEIFLLLSVGIIKWILIAGIIAAPVAYYFAERMLSAVAVHTSLHWTIFVMPVIIQLAVALIVTSGVSLKVLSRNPIEALKTE